MPERFSDWELQTIQALAYEALERASGEQFVRYPDRFREKFEADLQRDAMDERSVRTSIARHADRLNIGRPHSPRVDEMPHYEVTPADPETIHRWGRVQSLVFQLPPDHEWISVYRELVTAPVVESRMTAGWNVPDDGFGILGHLEMEARRLGLIGAEDAEPITVGALLAKMISRVGPSERKAA